MDHWADPFCTKNHFSNLCSLTRFNYLYIEPAFYQEWYLPTWLHRLISIEQMVKGWWSVKRSSSLGSSMDNKVVRYNSGLILGIKDHIYSDTAVCPVASYILITQCVVMHAWLLSLPTIISWATIPTQCQWSLICSCTCYCFKWDSSPFLQYKCWTHFSLHHTLSPELRTHQTQEKTWQQENHTRL